MKNTQVDARMAVRVRLEQRRKLDAIAKRQGMSVSQVIRLAIEQFLNQTKL